MTNNKQINKSSSSSKIVPHFLLHILPSPISHIHLLNSFSGMHHESTITIERAASCSSLTRYPSLLCRITSMRAGTEYSSESSAGSKLSEEMIDTISEFAIPQSITQSMILHGPPSQTVLAESLDSNVVSSYLLPPNSSSYQLAAPATAAAALVRFDQPASFAMYLLRVNFQTSFTSWRGLHAYSETPSKSSAEAGLTLPRLALNGPCTRTLSLPKLPIL